MQTGRQREDVIVRRQKTTTEAATTDGPNDDGGKKSSRGIRRRWRGPHGGSRPAIPRSPPPVVVIVVATTALLLLLLAASSFLPTHRPRKRDNREEAATEENRGGGAVRPAEATPPTIVGGRPTRRVVAYLRDLAELSPPRLWDALGMDAEDGDPGDDPFSLGMLEGGRCPWRDRDAATAAAPWYRPRPHDSGEIAAIYRANQGGVAARGRGRPLAMERPPEKMGGHNANTGEAVALWYEHVSKAGGTAFCALAGSNMEMWQVPRYHCMPGKGDSMMDGHVGRWTNDELGRHLAEHRHAIVSSEWEPFRLSRLGLSGRGLGLDDDGGRASRISNGGPRLLFLTTLRDPCDRLLSAYTFFEVTRKHNARNYDPPSFLEWMAGNVKRAAKYERGTGKRYGLLGWTTSHNHVTWRFSGGMLPPPPSPNVPPGGDDAASGWTIPFEVAIRALCQFDSILPMDVMTKDGLGKVALGRLLGWTNFEARVDRPGVDNNTDADAKIGHVVSTGRIQNSRARSYFSKVEYRRLWEDNRLDHILYLWCRAVFLARLHCDFDS